jgi:hypothetical protein
MNNHFRIVKTLATLGVALGATTACQFHARSAEQYRDATQELLMSRQSQIQSCYDDVLKQDKAAQGMVKVNFTVQKDTGTIVDPAVDPNGTTAPQPLSDCVVNSINGLALTPPDARDGLATFVYEFKQQG